MENKISKALVEIENISKSLTLVKASYLIKKRTVEEIVKDFKAAGIDKYADQISKLSAIIDTISNNKVLKIF